MKNLFTESLNNRILKYSIAAGAVLASSTKVMATVQVTTVNDILNTPNSSSLNITFGGSTKFTISFETTFLTYLNYSGVIRAATGSGSLFKTSHQSFALSQSQTIPTKTSWATPANRDFMYTSTQSLFNTAFSNHFKNSTKYLGVKFKLIDGIHYGWVEIQCGSDLRNGFEVLKYAYQDQPNTPINSPLPVELTLFTVKNIGNKIELKWNTATEVNNYGFDIERKILNQFQNDNWGKIGFIKGSSNSNSPKSYSFVDDNPVSGDVEYRLKQIDNDGQFVYSKIVKVTTQPTQFILGQNYPNPFNPTTTIRYAIPETEHVILKVYDELGKEVKTLVDENKEAGQYNVQFNGSGLASGIYYYRITSGEFTEVKKLMLLK